MNAWLALRALAWFVLLAAAALALDGFDRTRRLTGLRAELAAAENAAASSPKAARADSAATDAPPPPVDDRLALRPLPDDTAFRGAAAAESAGANDPASPPLPGRPVTTSWAVDGTRFVLITDPGRFPIWFVPPGADRWQPIGGSGAVQSIAAGEPGTLYVAGRALGRWRDNAWTWTDWPDRFEGRALLAHGDAPLVVAWGRGQLAFSRDGGQTLRRLRLTDLAIRTAALDPARSGVVLVSATDGVSYAVDLDRVQ